MKIRCTENSIRLRIRKPDIEQLDREGMIRTELNVGPGQILVFELRKENIAAIRAIFTDNLLSVQVPEVQADTWIQTGQVGLEQEQSLPDGKTLHILIEKDFPCKHQPTENPEDTFQDLNRS